jgi:hypothetical protein
MMFCRFTHKVTAGRIEATDGACADEENVNLSRSMNVSSQLGSRQTTDLDSWPEVAMMLNAQFQNLRLCRES